MRRARERNLMIAPAGFTLIEVVLVAAIIAVFAAMAMPRLGSATSSNRASLAAQKVAADLAYLRFAARAQSSTTSMVISTATNSYTLAGVSPTGIPDPVVRLANFPYACTFTVQDNSTAPLTFDANGTPSRDIDLRVKCGAFSRKVLVTRNGGGITVK